MCAFVVFCVCFYFVFDDLSVLVVFCCCLLLFLWFCCCVLPSYSGFAVFCRCLVVRSVFGFLVVRLVAISCFLLLDIPVCMPSCVLFFVAVFLRRVFCVPSLTHLPRSPILRPTFLTGLPLAPLVCPPPPAPSPPSFSARQRIRSRGAQ